MLPAQFIRDELYHTVRAHPAGGGSLDGYILQADMNTARDELRTLLPGDEFVTDRGNILLAISKRN